MNPVTPNAENFSILEDKPARLYAIKDHIDWHTTYDSYTFDSGTGLSQTYFTAEDFVFNWAEGDGGVLTDTVSNWWANAGDSGWGTVKQQVNWPADTYIPSQNGDITSSVCDSNGCVAGAGTTGPPLDLVAGSACNVSYWDHCAVQIPDNTFQSGLTRNSDAMVKWCSGGKAVPGRMSLVSLWADVLKLDPKTGGPGGTGIPGHLVQAGVFGQLGDDGMAYKMLADGQPYDLTLRVAGTGFTVGTERYTRGMNSPTKHKLRIMANGNPLSPTTVMSWANYCVGQYMNFYPVFIPSVPGIQQKTVIWVFDGTYVNDHTNAGPSTSDNYFMNPFQVTNENTHAWWVSGGNVFPGVEVPSAHWNGSVFANGQNAVVTSKGLFNMHRPSLVNWTQDCGPTIVTNYTIDLGLREVIRVGTPDGTNAMAFHTKVSSAYEGVAGFTQVYDDESYPNNNGSNVLDVAEMYPHEGPITVHTNTGALNTILFDDSPYEGSYLGGSSVSLVLQFKDYARFMPSGGGPNIYVTLGKVIWNVNATATYTNGAWVLNPGNQVVPSWDSSQEFPYWETVRDR